MVFAMNNEVCAIEIILEKDREHGSTGLLKNELAFSLLSETIVRNWNYGWDLVNGTVELRTWNKTGEAGGRLANYMPRRASPLPRPSQSSCRNLPITLIIIP